MIQIFHPDHPVGQVLSHVLDLFILSILWFILSMTVAGCGPASTALYYSVMKSVRKGQDSVTHSFFHAIRENWKPALIIGLICAVFCLSVCLIDLPNILAMLTQSAQFSPFWSTLSIIKLLLLTGLMVYVFPILSRFQISVPGAVIKSLGFLFLHPLRSAAAVGLLLVSVYLGLTLPMLLLILPALTALVFSFLLEPVLKEMLPEDFRETHSEENLWYLE